MPKIEQPTMTITDEPVGLNEEDSDQDDDDTERDYHEHFSERDLCILEFALPQRRRPLLEDEREDFDCFMMALLLNASQLVARKCPSKACRDAEICTQPPLKCRRRAMADAYEWKYERQS